MLSLAVSSTSPLHDNVPNVQWPPMVYVSCCDGQLPLLVTPLSRSIISCQVCSSLFHHSCTEMWPIQVSYPSIAFPGSSLFFVYRTLKVYKTKQIWTKFFVQFDFISLIFHLSSGNRKIKSVVLVDCWCQLPFIWELHASLGCTANNR